MVRHGERTMPASGMTTWWGEVRAVLMSASRAVQRRDASVSAGVLTYFAGIAVVPWLLLGCWSATFFLPASEAEQRLRSLGALVPPDMGARGPYAALVEAGVGLGLTGAVVTLFPATFYGEGIRRACLSLVPEPDRGRLTGWRARASMLPLLVLLPFVSYVVAMASGPLVDLASHDGLWPHLGRIISAFTISWLALTVPLTWIFRRVAPGLVCWRSAALGALGTASFLAGFLQGFLLFLSIPVDLGVPFGGLDVVGGVVAVGLWLFLLHLVVLLGWVVTSKADDRLRHEAAS